MIISVSTLFFSQSIWNIIAAQDPTTVLHQTLLLLLLAFALHRQWLAFCLLLPDFFHSSSLYSFLLANSLNVLFLDDHFTSRRKADSGTCRHFFLLVIDSLNSCCRLMHLLPQANFVYFSLLDHWRLFGQIYGDALHLLLALVDRLEDIAGDWHDTGLLHLITALLALVDNPVARFLKNCTKLSPVPPHSVLLGVEQELALFAGVLLDEDQAGLLVSLPTRQPTELGLDEEVN